MTSSRDCLELCLTESEFECRSVNYDRATGVCTLSDMDRHTIADTKFRDRYFSPSQNTTEDYYENNCIKGQ